jgi:hypothetical protein
MRNFAMMKTRKSQSCIMHWLPRRIAALLAAGSLSLLTACASGAKVPLTHIFGSQQCAIDEARLIFLEDQTQLNDFIAAANRFTLSANPMEMPQLTVDGRAIVVAWGNQPTPGYRLQLHGTTAPVKEETLQLPVSFIRPASGQLHAQVMTSPCIVVAVGSRQGYRQVQAGELSAGVP